MAKKQKEPRVLVNPSNLRLLPPTHENTLFPGSSHTEADCPGNPPCMFGKRDDLQDLYSHLDHCDHGNLFLAWYGQCRAKDMTHEEAIQDTVDHFRLMDTDWYPLRLERMKKQ